MAVWKAEIKPIQNSSSFSVQVIAGSSEMARRTIEAQWGKVYWMRNLRVISERDDDFYQESPKQSYEDNTTFEEKFWLGVVFVVGYLIFVYWYVAVPLIFIIGLLWWWAKDD
jgi:hypothetical protein